MLGSEGVLKVKNGEEKTDKFPQSDDQRYDQRGTLCGEDEHATNAHILSDTVAKNVEPQLGHAESSK